jgi:homoserine O-acetyltransferase
VQVIDNPYYTHEFHGDYELVDIGGLDLEEGGHLPSCQLAMATFGTLNERKDNAILIPTWYSGTHQTWRDMYIGPGHALDPERYFIVSINQIGSGLSSSPHNTVGELGMSGFPTVRIGDDAVAQERLLREHFGIEELALVVGGSMGAQQTYEWAVRFPDKVRRAAPIAGTAQTTPHDYLYAQAVQDTITTDPGWASGEYSSHEQVVDGLKRQAHLWALMGFSTEFWKTEGWRAAELESMDACLTDFLEPVFTAMDPNDLLTQAWKWQHADVARNASGDLTAALGQVKAKMFVMPIDADMFFPVSDCEAEQSLTPESELRVLTSTWGHLALFGVEPKFVDQIDQHLSELLAIDV